METSLPNIKPIGTVAVPCLVLEKNRVQFIEFDADYVVGKVLSVPCRSVDEDSTGDVWAVPIRDYGVFTGLQFIPKTDEFAINPPTYDSKTAFRIWDKITEELEWYILGSRTDFFNSCSTCCGATYTPMPGVNADGSNNLSWVIAPTVQLGDATDTNGHYISYWGIPSLDAGYNYFPYGSYNDIAFPTAPSTGFATKTDLLNWLNANCSSVGSPAVPTLTWTIVNEAGSGIGTLLATGGHSGDVIGLSVIQVLA